MKFAHIADTHIRNLRFHYEYNEVFKQLYDSLEKEKVDYIIHCGDIAHTKTQISPEFVEMAAAFFTNLSKIAPTYIILGNHDGNLKNSNRQDALSPIIDALSLKNLHLLKGAGETNLNKDFCINVLSVFDEDNWVSPTDPDRINIALYHGAIDRSKTDLNWTLGGDHDISIFEDFDFAFLGDIHKTQQLDKEGRIWYAGSTVQQNFGESLDKGYLLWDIESKDKFTNKLITFSNPKPFVTLVLNKDGTLPEKEVPEGARLRLVAEHNVSPDVWRKSVDVAKYKFKPESVTYTNKASSSSVEVGPEGLKGEDLRDIKTQNKLIAEYLEDFEVSEDVMDKVFSLNQRLNKHIEEKEDVFRNVNWNIESLEWDGLFNYGEGNKIDFTKLGGIVGIFGKNFSGKSSVIDSLIYAIYNTTSKSSKTINIINQNLNAGYAKAKIKVGGLDYHIERTSTKEKNGASDAKTVLDFYTTDSSGERLSKNGNSRTETDKNIRRYFGTVEDFLMTSMASQLDSLKFINEGSTKRKAILAKFLDLQVFESKFKMAKEESQDIRGALRRLEGISFDEKIEEAQSALASKNELLETNRRRCKELEGRIDDLQKQINSIQNKIDAAPTDVIDPVKIKMEIETRTNKVEQLKQERNNLQEKITKHKKKYSEISSFLEQFDIDTYEEKKKRIIENREEIARLINEMSIASDEKFKLQQRSDLLNEVPCGNSFPECNFIKDAHEATGLVQIKADLVADMSMQINSIAEGMHSMDPDTVLEYVEKFQQLADKKNQVSDSIAKAEISIDKTDSDIFKQNTVLEKLVDKLNEYEENKEAIENLEELIAEKKSLKSKVRKDTKECETCKSNTNSLLREVGSAEQKIKHLQESKEELETLRTEFAAYELFMRCCHSNGISYNIIKNRLPIINEEIAKILTGIVDFEIFIMNDDKKLDIFIKHPKFEPRLLEMGSGAEKTIASMAIRLAFLSVSSLPKPDIFIMDEPGTALDENNMEGFVRIIDMVKSYFKTVILISHLDTLKDAVDTQIMINKKKGFAHVSV